MIVIKPRHVSGRIFITVFVIKLVTIIAFTTVLITCDTSGASSSEEELPEGNSRVTFSYDGNVMASRSSAVRTTTGQEPNELIWVDVSSELPEIHHKPMETGKNELFLPKEGVHLVGFVYNEALARVLSGDRSITGALQTIANLGIVSAGLGSLPLSENAEDSIDLGAISLAGTIMTSGMQLPDAADATGYSPGTLLEFGIFDPSLYVFLNPDIDANGIYDQEENLLWTVTQQKYLLFNAGEIDDDWSIPKSIDEHVGQHNLVFWLGTGFEHPVVQDVFLRFPQDRIYMTDTGEQVEGIAPFWETNNGGNVPLNNTNQYYIPLRSRTDLIPKPPYNGNYTLEISGKPYYINNLNVQGGDGGSYEGFTFPALRFDIDSNDIITAIHCRWKTAVGMSYREPSPEEIKLKIKQLIFDFGDSTLSPEDSTPEVFGANYYDSFTIDASRLRLNIHGLPPWGIACGYWDISGSDHRIEYPLD